MTASLRSSPMSLPPRRRHTTAPRYRTCAPACARRSDEQRATSDAQAGGATRYEDRSTNRRVSAVGELDYLRRASRSKGDDWMNGPGEPAEQSNTLTRRRYLAAA